MILSDFTKYSEHARPLCDSWASCLYNEETSLRWTMADNNNNNNNNKHDNVYGAVIMAEPLREFTRFIW